MKNLSKELLINELNVKTAVLKEIEKKIEDGNIHNEAHRYYKWKHETIGAIEILNKLLENGK